MYPRDNIFNIYYNIGKRTPFQVKRSRSLDKKFRYSKKGKTFMVERVEPRGQYGKAFGYCLIDDIRNDEYMKEVQEKKKENQAIVNKIVEILKGNNLTVEHIEVILNMTREEVIKTAHL